MMTISKLATSKLTTGVVQQVSVVFCFFQLCTAVTFQEPSATLNENHAEHPPMSLSRCRSGSALKWGE